MTTTSSAQLLSYETASLGQAEGNVVCTFDNGWPDGMAVRPDGGMWVALTGGDRLDLVGPSGQILDSVALPSGSLPTNVCFDGERVDELYVTASFQQALLRIRL